MYPPVETSKTASSYQITTEDINKNDLLNMFPPVETSKTAGSYQITTDQEPIDFFNDWFIDARDFNHNIKYYLNNQGYLTEGDVARCVGLESSVENPFYYYYGDLDAYRKDMMDILFRSANKVFDEESKDPGYLKDLRAVIKALKYLENNFNFNHC